MAYHKTISHDADTGPKQVQKFPTIDSISLNGGNTIFNGTLRSEPIRHIDIEVSRTPLATLGLWRR